MLYIAAPIASGESRPIQNHVRVVRGAGGPNKRPRAKPQAAALQRGSQPAPIYLGVGCATLLALNYLTFIASNVVHLSTVSFMPLVVGNWQWWQVRFGYRNMTSRRFEVDVHCMFPVCVIR
jgi:hypothetical protein